MPKSSYEPLPYIDDEKKLTAITYQDMFFRIERLALNTPRWDNLPKEVNQMFLERYLFYFGMCAFFRDDELDKYLVLPVITELAWDQNNFPTEYFVEGFMGYRKRLNYENSVLIFDNYTLSPGMAQAQLFASRLTNALRTIDVHLEANKIGKIIAAPESQRKSIKNFLKKIANFQLYTIGSNTLMEATKGIYTLDTQPNFILDKLDFHYTFLWNDVLAYYGIYGGSTRLSGVTPIETISENSQADVNRCAILNARQDAAEKINEMFGLNIGVGCNVNTFAGNGGDGIGGEAQNGTLHNDTQNSAGSADQSD